MADITTVRRCEANNEEGERRKRYPLIQLDGTPSMDERNKIYKEGK